jgi:hypothetical protein
MRKSPRDARSGRIQTAAQKENGGHARVPRAARQEPGWSSISADDVVVPFWRRRDVPAVFRQFRFCAKHIASEQSMDIAKALHREFFDLLELHLQTIVRTYQQLFADFVEPSLASQSPRATLPIGIYWADVWVMSGARHARYCHRCTSGWPPEKWLKRQTRSLSDASRRTAVLRNFAN